MTGQPTAEPVGESRPGRGGLGAWVLAHPTHVIDLFVYVVVLNLAVQFLPAVISETFTLSLLTAALLKVTLELVLVLKGAVLARFRTATSPVVKVTSAPCWRRGRACDGCCTARHRPTEALVRARSLSDPRSSAPLVSATRPHGYA